MHINPRLAVGSTVDQSDSFRCVDVVVIGGGAAGLTAALVLSRARRTVTVVDDGTYRNAAVEEFHGFPTRDGTAPSRFRADALSELRSYGVAVTTASAPIVSATDRTVTVELSDGLTIEAAATAFLKAPMTPRSACPRAGMRRRYRRIRRHR